MDSVVGIGTSAGGFCEGTHHDRCAGWTGLGTVKYCLSVRAVPFLRQGKVRQCKAEGRNLGILHKEELGSTSEARELLYMEKSEGLGGAWASAVHSRGKTYCCGSSRRLLSCHCLRT